MFRRPWLLRIWVILSIVWLAGGATDGQGVSQDRREDVPKRDIFNRGASAGTDLEWWYLTGPLWTGVNCHSETGFPDGSTRDRKLLATHPDWGLQLTYFHSGKEPRRGLLFHGALSNVAEKFHEPVVLAEPWIQNEMSGLLSGASKSRLDLRMGPHFLVDVEDANPKDGTSVWWARLSTSRYDVRLNLRVREERLWSHGQGGLVEKLPGSANWYVSYPFIPVRGTVFDKRLGQSTSVCGSLWFDHEVDVGIAQDLAWSWFSIRLSQGEAYMFYQIWDAKKGFVRTHAGTVPPEEAVLSQKPVGEFGEKFENGKLKSTQLSDVKFSYGNKVCLSSGACYPQSFEIRFRDNGKERFFRLLSLFPEQEIDDPQVRSYWEGLAQVEGEDGEVGLAIIEMTREIPQAQIP